MRLKIMDGITEIKRRKVFICLTNRAHWGRLKSVIRAIDNHPELELQLVVGGSALLDKYGAVVDDIEKEYEVLDKLYCVIDGDKPSNMADTTGNLILKLTGILERLNPDVVLVHADRYEQLAVALAASYMNIPVAHTQGGEATGSIDDKVRNAITMLADWHFPSTERSANRISDMNDWWGDNATIGIVNVGCPSIDLIPKDLTISDDYNLKYGGVGCEIYYSKPYTVVMFHPDTTEYRGMEEQTEELIKAVKEIGLQTLWFWSNVDAGSDKISGTIRRYREKGEMANVRFVKNFNPEDFYNAISNSHVFLGNSSSGIREGAYLGVKYVCIGNRQRNREHADNVIFCDCNRLAIITAYMQIIKRDVKPSALYGDGTAGEKIADILLGVDLC